ncbi:MAG TPA: T9SS type A sorting domain-containing protein [Bacteroidales bacterium]|nr:T9SS type A sorting domain-containing protein [Bacteroidales bacterium]
MKTKSNSTIPVQLYNFRIFRTLIISAIWFLIFALPSGAQNVINASGGMATGSGGNVSYSVGQLLNSFDIGSNGSVAKGVQQPYEISVLTDAETLKDNSLTFSLYPNPASDFLTLKVEGDNISGLFYRLLDTSGKLLGTGQLTGNETIIQMSSLPPSVYILKISSGSKPVRTFKIIKN